MLLNSSQKSAKKSGFWLMTQMGKRYHR